MQYGDLATWVASIGTVGALSTALYQIRIERDARHRADRESIERVLRSQAQLVSGWYGGHVEGSDQDQSRWDWLVVLNSSPEPVYQAVATLVFIQGSGPQTGEGLPRARHDGRIPVHDGTHPSGTVAYDDQERLGTYAGSAGRGGCFYRPRWESLDPPGDRRLGQDSDQRRGPLRTHAAEDIRGTLALSLRVGRRSSCAS